MNAARAVAEAVRAAGGRALIVGGWVRDRIMQRGSDTPNIDLEVFGHCARPTQSAVNRLAPCVGP